jgi:hypothetical protein
MSATKIPEPWDRNAPIFQGEEDKLRQFLGHMERLMSKSKTPAAEQKETLVLYVEPKIAEQWKAFPTYKKGTPEEFLAEIINHYPSVRDSEKGSITILNRALKPFPEHGISVEDQDGLLELIREVQVEIKKLIPRTLNNKQAIARFVEKLDKDFTNRMWTRLEMNELAEDAIPVDPTDAVAVAARKTKIEERANERYLFDDVLTVVRELSKGSVDRGEYDTGATTTKETNPVKKTDFKSEFEAMVSILDKKNKEGLEGIKQWTVGLMDKMEVKRHADSVKLDQFLKAVPHGGYQAPAVVPVESRPTVVNNMMPPYRSTMENTGCHYCKEMTHFIGDCKDRHGRLERGDLKVVNGRDHLGDGTPLYIPRGKSRKDAVDEHFGKTLAQNYYGAPTGMYLLSDLESPAPQSDYDPRDDEIWSMHVSEEKLKRQLAQLQNMNKTTQLVQHQTLGVVQPAPEAPVQNTSELSQALGLLATMAQQMQATQQQFIAQTRGNPNRAETSGK